MTAATKAEIVQLYQEIVTLCNTECKPVFYKDDTSLRAYSNIDNTINISSAMLYVMPIEYLRSIVYHEYAHIICKHSQQAKALLDYIKKNNIIITQNDITVYRHYQELEADKIACFLMYRDYIPNYLIDALLSVTPKENLYKRTATHPSTYDRIQRIIYYGTQYNNYRR